MWPSAPLSLCGPAFPLGLLFHPLFCQEMLAGSPYQAQYARNLGLLKCKYQKLVPRRFSLTDQAVSPSGPGSR